MNDIVAVCSAITSALETALNSAGCALVEGSIPDAADMPRINGQVVPTASVYFAAPESGARGGVGITGLKHSMASLTGSVICVAENYTDCRNLMLLVSDVLNGLEPGHGAGEVRCLGSAQAGPDRDILRPGRYAQTVGFALSTGANVVIA